VALEALKTADPAKNPPSDESKSRLGQLVKDYNNKDSGFWKAFKLLPNGINKLATTFGGLPVGHGVGSYSL